ncbi:MAG: hypothetical protein ACSLFQ_16800 [Thermoanaerobaculia bacterium]
MRQLWFALASLLMAGSLAGDPALTLVSQSRRATGSLSTAASETKRPVEGLVEILDADTEDLAEVKRAVGELRSGTKEALDSATARIARVSSRAFRERLSSAYSLREAEKLLKEASAAYPAIDGAQLMDSIHHLALHSVRDVLRQHLAAADTLREGLAASLGVLQKNAATLEEAMTRGLLERTPEVAR